MISLSGRPQHACDGHTRREMLRLGGLGALGLSLPQVLGRTAKADGQGPGFGQARSCLLVYLFGGPSQLDTFDLKPDAPDGFRGEFHPIATRTAGVSICEHLPQLATQSDKFCLIRSMCHEHPRHGWGLYYMLTGRKHNRPDLDAPPTPDDFPGLGALVNKLGRPTGAGPAAVTLPRWNRFNDLPNDYAGERAGFLGGSFNPWLVGGGGDGMTFGLENVELPADVPVARLAERRRLLTDLERTLGGLGESGRVHDDLHSQAYRLLGSPEVRRAFRLDEESTRLRDRYGRHPFGQGLLLARRLVEAGTTLVQVNWHNDGSDVKSPFWDTHKDNFHTLKDRLLPPLDTALSALLMDLDGRGLLETTLVLVMGEFGRTPRIGQIVMNAATDKSGRDHWPHAYTVLAAGGGVRGGTVFGASDDRAAFVTDRPVSPPDLQATVLHALGIDPSATIVDRRGLVHHASLGNPVLGLF